MLVTLRGMRFRWDWLRPVLTAPYVPTLGPVQPGALSAELFNAVVDIADTDRFLSYDKDRRWSSKKDERVIVQAIVHRPGLTMIPTSVRGCGLVKFHHYGDNPPQRSELARWMREQRAVIGAATGRVVWFQETPEGARTRLLLKTFREQDKRRCCGVIQLANCAVGDTFPAFAEQLGERGFFFVYQRIRAGFSDGPVLVRVEDQRIVGAIGPMAIMLDATGTRIQLPQYFAVHPRYRRRGHGRALWRAAMAWGAENGAKYKVLQAASGSVSELFYMSEGLSTLGFMCSMTGG